MGKSETRSPFRNDSIIHAQCQNGLMVFYGAVNTGKNFGVVGIGATPKLNSRTIIVSSLKVAETIANLLIADFGGEIKLDTMTVPASMIKEGDTIINSMQIGKVIKVFTAYAIIHFMIELPSGGTQYTRWYQKTDKIQRVNHEKA